jgi:hypothetical protein
MVRASPDAAVRIPSHVPPLVSSVPAAFGFVWPQRGGFVDVLGAVARVRM